MRYESLRIRPVVANVAVAATVGLLVAIVVGATLDRPSSAPKVLIDNLQVPQGLTLTDLGGLLLTEIQAGRLLHLQPDGNVRVILQGLPYTQGEYPTGVASAMLVNGVYHYIIGEHRTQGYSALYRFEPGGAPQMLAGGVDKDGLPETAISNPYDLVAAPFGGIFISDGGSNSVFRVTPRGRVHEYATFPRREIPRDSQLEGGSPTMDVVPTGLTYGPDGALYVVSFTGFPYPNRAAYVYRVEDQNGDGDALDDGEITVYASGFSAATSIAFQEDGDLLVTEYSTDMLRLVLDEGGVEHAGKVAGRLVRWREGEIEVLVDGLVSPTSVVVRDGKAFVVEQFAGRVTKISLDDSGRRFAWNWATVAGLISAVLVFSLLARRGRSSNTYATSESRSQSKP